MIEHCSRCSKTINWSADSFHVTSMSWPMSPQYGHGILVSGYPVWQQSIDHVVNVQCKRCGLAKTRLRHPSQPFDSLPYPTRTIRRRVRMYVRSVNHVTTKRKEVDHILWVWGSSRAWEPSYEGTKILTLFFMRDRLPVPFDFFVSGDKVIYFCLF